MSHSPISISAAPVIYGRFASILICECERSSGLMLLLDVGQHVQCNICVRTQAYTCRGFRMRRDESAENVGVMRSRCVATWE